MNSKVSALLGALGGFVIPFVSLYIISQLRPELLVIQRYDLSEIRHLNIQIMTVAMLPNIALFFVALQFGKESFSRGLLAASFLLLVLLFIYRFLL